MSFAITDYSPNLFSSIGFYGQKPRWCDLAKPFKPSQKLFVPQSETALDQCKRYAWTFLPILTLSPPIGSVVNSWVEMIRIAQSINLLLKRRELTTASYQAFRIVLSAGAIGNTLLDHSSSKLFRKICLVIRILVIGHEIALAAHRIYRLQDNPGSYKITKLCSHILNNILSLIAIIFHNPSSTFLFLILQSLTGAFQFARKLEKDKYPAAVVHLFLAFFRLYQSYVILYRQILAPSKSRPELVLPSVEELAKARLLMQIDPAEKIKETLTQHENEIKTHLGEDYLYFKRNGPEEKFLILTTETDHNTALAPSRLASLIKMLSQKFDVKFRTISTVEDIEKEVRSATQIGRVMGLMLRAHGSPTGMLLSWKTDSGRLDSKTISPDLFAGLDPHCIIVLDSCSTGQYPFFSLAYRVANISQRITIAPDSLITNLTLKQLDPLEWEYNWFKRKVGTKKVVPLQDDRFITYLKDLLNIK